MPRPPAPPVNPPQPATPIPIVVPIYPYVPSYPLLVREPEHRLPPVEVQPRVIVVEREFVRPDWREGGRSGWRAARGQPYAPPEIHIIGAPSTRHMRGPVKLVHGVAPPRRIATEPRVIWLKEPVAGRWIVKAGS